MTDVPHSDAFIVANGPEDGTLHPLVRSPVDIGRGGECGVIIRLDEDVERVHARVSVVPEGYRIRRAGKSPVFANGRRVGAVRSRIVRTGDVVRMGGTELVLQCVPDGLASRSRGLPLEGDAAWAVRHGLGVFRQGFRGSWRVTGFLLGSAGRSIIGFAVLLVALLAVFIVQPEWVSWLYYRVIEPANTFIRSFF
jgi:hypothetical protein